VEIVSNAAAPRGAYHVTCPHCRRRFEAHVLPGSAARYNGFKCPHCRLFVPFERVSSDAQQPPAS
jgi:hypothetical protein